MNLSFHIWNKWRSFVGNIVLIRKPFISDGVGLADPSKTDTLNSTGSAGQRRAGGAKKHTQANKSALRAPRALCCLTLSNPIRMAALALVEWKYPSAQVCLCANLVHSLVCFQDSCFLDLRPLSLLIYSFYWPSLPTVLPLVCPNHFLKTIPMPPTTIWWVCIANITTICHCEWKLIAPAKNTSNHII